MGNCNFCNNSIKKGKYCNRYCWTEFKKGKPLSKECREGYFKMAQTNPPRYWLGKKRPKIGKKISQKLKEKYANGLTPWNRGKSMKAYPYVGFQKGNKFGHKPSIFRGKTIPEERKKRISQTMKGKIPANIELLNANKFGKGNPMWKGGVTPLRELLNQTIRYEEWRKKILKRDNYTCQGCGQIGGLLQVNHIISYFELREIYKFRTTKEALDCQPLWDINNGETLCFDCHIKTDTFGAKVFKISQAKQYRNLYKRP